MSGFSRALLVLGLAACSAHRRIPITAGDVSGSRDDDALVAYLAQRDASASVCDLRAAGPHLAQFDAGDLVTALRERPIAPVLWRECVELLARSTERERSFQLLDEVVRSYQETIADPRVEYLPLTQAQLGAMHTLLADRPGGIRPHTRESEDLIAHLRDAVDRKELGLVATRLANDMIVADELGRGVRGAQQITDDALQALFQARDSATLRRAATRLPDPLLREHAQRLGIRLKIQASPYLAVRQEAPAVEETMMRLGVNPVSTTAHRPVRAWIDSSFAAGRSIRIRQDLRRHTNTLLADSANGGLSVVPQQSLRGALHVEVEGIDRPVTVCGSREEVDPSPCLSPNELSSDSPLVHLEADGTVRFSEQLADLESMALASTGPRLLVPLRVGSATLAELAWDFAFETPADLVIESHTRDGDGPNLQIRVEPLKTGRVAYTVVDGDESYQAIVENARASSFHVISRGSDGASGSDGSAGLDGSPGPVGSSASCPSYEGTSGGGGGNGGAGGDGDAGHSGGEGGRVVVDVMRGDGNLPALLALLRTTIRSEGGDGGKGGTGGKGGRGGAGGSGGSGTTCVDAKGHVTTLSGGSAGPSGTDGREGFDGSHGSNGRAGDVSVRVVP